jgi:HK97 family phage major capsid protein
MRVLSEEEAREELAAARARRETLAGELEQVRADGDPARTVEHEAALRQLDSDIFDLDNEVRGRELLRRVERHPRSAVPGTDFGGGRSSDDGRTTRDGGPNAQLRGEALRANELAERMPDAAREHMARQLELDEDPDGRLARFVVETSSDHYFRAFSKWLRDPLAGGHEWTHEEREAVNRVRWLERALSLTGASGGFMTLPYELDPQVLISGAGASNPLREIGRVATTTQNEKRFVTAASVVAHWYDEAAEVSDDTPVFAQPVVTTRKGMAFLPVSFELFADSDIAEQVGAMFADAKANLEAAGFTVGTGVAPQPLGIITALVAAGGATVIATASNVLAAADLLTNQAALPPRWRGNAKWMMNLPIINGYRAIPLATGLNYSMVDDSGPLPKALGWEIHENSAMDSSLTGGAADYLVLSGDFQQFGIVDRVGTAIELAPILVGANQRPTGQRGFVMHWRTGSGVLIADAFRLSNFST